MVFGVSSGNPGLGCLVCSLSDMLFLSCMITVPVCSTDPALGMALWVRDSSERGGETDREQWSI